jgi:hypothetical protein
MPSSGLHLSQPSDDAGSREKGLMQADSIISFAISHAMWECPELVQKDLITFIRRATELAEENDALNRRLARLLGGEVNSKGR